MSKIIEGKISNQCHMINLNGKVRCAKCCKSFEPPSLSTLESIGKVFKIFHYLDSGRFIYETNAGTAIVYCSDYCRRKHNHRFQKG